ncbi:MAG: autotransporter domain-containing protein [Maritimibacter sp.]
MMIPLLRRRRLYLRLTTALVASAPPIGLPVGAVADSIDTTATVIGTGGGTYASPWNIFGNLSVGDTGTGSLAIFAGGTVSNGFGHIGYNSVSSGTVTVDGAGSQWTLTGDLIVGDAGSGSLTLSDGGTVTVGGGSAYLGLYSGSTGTLSIGAAAGDAAVAPGMLDSPTLAFGAGTGALAFNHTDSAYEFAPDVVSTVPNLGSILLYSGTTSFTGDTSGFSGTLRVKAGTLLIQSGQKLPSLNGYVGDLSGSTGTATITGSGSSWTTSSLYLGTKNDSTGNVAISDGGTVSTVFGYIGDASGANGTVTVQGDGSNWTNTSNLLVGNGGTGTLAISDGGTVSDSWGIVGDASGSNGTVTVEGAGASWTNTNELYVGNEGAGTLAISAGGSVSSGISTIGAGNSSNGAVTVDGAGSDWTNSGSLYVGLFGSGTLSISDGGTVSANSIIVANSLNATGTLNIGAASGDAAVAAGMLNTPTLAFGAGFGTLVFNHTDSSYDFDTAISGGGTISHEAGTTNLTGDNSGFWGETRVSGGTLNVGGSLGSSKGYIGYGSGSTGTVTVDGMGASWTNLSSLFIGDSGAGTLAISNRGSVSNSLGIIGLSGSSTGTVTVDGVGSSWVNSGELRVGYLGTATLAISAGGAVSDTDGTIGYADTTSGTVTVDGAGSSWTNSGALFAGGFGTGTLTISAGGAVSDIFGYIGYESGSTGTVTVDGTGSSWANSSDLTVGHSGTGTLAISNGGAVSSDFGYIGNASGSTGVVTVDGSGSSWTNSAFLYVGENGAGALTVGTGGMVSADSVFITHNAGSTGTLNIGAASGDAAVAAGTLNTPTLTFGDDTGTLVFNHTDSGYDFDTAIIGHGTINHLAGETSLSGNSFGFTGTTEIAGGTLSVNGSLAGTVNVTGGTLGGSGVSLEFELGDPAGVAGTDSDLITVGHNLVLDGTLNVTDAGSFGQGLYRLIDYHGTLTDNGLDLGDLPAGYAASDLEIQTAISGQVNLNVGVPTLFAYWDGTGAESDGTITGGAGSWSTSATNWTLPDGSANGAYHPDTFLVFAGTPGTVSIDASGGAITTSAGMQFASDGYVITGDDLGITGDATIRVGDGSSVGAGYEATIASNLTGAGNLTKTDLGTLTLTGDNSGFTGTTTLSEGLLNVDGMLGGTLTLAGGTLGGSGTLGTVDVTAGTLAPGHSVGTLNVGDLSFGSGSTYAVELKDGGFVAGTNNDFINATGTITLTGGTVTVAPENGTDDGSSYGEGTYTIASAAGGVTGTFASVSDSYLFLDFSLGYDANTVLLTSTRVADFASAADTPNQIATAGAVDGLASGHSLRDALLRVSTEVQAQVGYDALSGEGHATLASGTLQASRYQREAMLGQDGSTGLNRWASAYGGMMSLGSDGNAAAARAYAGGLIAGIDKGFTTGFGDAWLGASLHGGMTRLSVADRNTTISSNDLGAGIYGGAEMGATGIRFGADYTLHQISSSRDVSIGGFSDHLTASYTGGTAQIFGEIRHSFDLGTSTLTPFAGAAYLYDWTEGFTEAGGAAALNVAAKSNTALITTLGATVERDVTLNGQTATLSGTLGWRHAFGATPSIDANFTGGNSFSVNGAPIARDALILGAGVSFAMETGAMLDLSYSGEIGSTSSDHKLAAALTMSF